jgi:hypothetical protein
MGQVVCGVLAHEVHHGHARPAGVMQIRNPVPKTGAEMEECTRGFFRHPSVAVGGARNHSFEKTEDAAYFRFAVQCSNEMNLGCARIREAGFNSSSDQ